MKYRPALAVAQEVFDYLKTVCADLHVVRGDFDEPNKYLDEEVPFRSFDVTAQIR